MVGRGISRAVWAPRGSETVVEVEAAPAEGPVGSSSVDGGKEWRKSRRRRRCRYCRPLVFLLFWCLIARDRRWARVFCSELRSGRRRRRHRPRLERVLLRHQAAPVMAKAKGSDDDDGRTVKPRPLLSPSARPVLACVISTGAEVLAFGPSPALQHGSILMFEEGPVVGKEGHALVDGGLSWQVASALCGHPCIAAAIGKWHVRWNQSAAAHSPACALMTKG